MSPNFVSSLTHHLVSFIWLRWQIRRNQLAHGSAIGRALAAILLVLLLLTTFGCFIAGTAMGVFVPRLFPRENYFLTWDVISVVFLFVWMIHVVTDLQRSDAITFDKILHLPVPFSMAFAVNYLSSLANIHLIVLCSSTLGYIFGSCFSIGLSASLVTIPFLAFVFSITALTYQLQGWLAAIMSNPRRRRLVMIAVPFIFVIVSQVPAFFATQLSRRLDRDEPAAPRLASPDAPAPSDDSTAPPALPQMESNDSAPTPPRLEDAGSEASVDVPADSTSSGQAHVPSDASAEKSAESSEQTSDAESKAQPTSNESKRAWRRRNNQLQFESFVSVVRILNVVAPPLWMAGCAESILNGTSSALWITAVMLAVGTLSIRRNFRQTLRYYRGENDPSFGGKTKRAPSTPVNGQQIVSEVRKSPDPSKLRMLEWKLPWVSEETNAIMTMTWQSMSRAPEVKLYFLLPLVAPVILFFLLRNLQLPKIDELKAAIVVASSGFTLFISSSMLGNQFGFDRSGFRAFVLSPVRRENILLGRNLATAAVLVLQTCCFALAFGIFFGMSIDKILAAVLLSASILPLFGLLVNLMSILCPFPIAAGSMQPKHFDLIPVLISLALSTVMPMITVLAALPLGIEWGIEVYFKSITWMPIALILSVVWLAGSVLLYRYLLPYEGQLLAHREKELLRIVTSKIE